MTQIEFSAGPNQSIVVYSSGDVGAEIDPAAMYQAIAKDAEQRALAGWRIVSSALTVHGVVPGIDAATFTSLAEAAKDNCPVSSMMRGNVALSVEATLEG